MGIRSFKSYLAEFREFYNGVVKLMEMEDRFSKGGEASLEEVREYMELRENILSQCNPGTNIEDSIGLVAVGESRINGKSKNYIFKYRNV